MAGHFVFNRFVAVAGAGQLVFGAKSGKISNHFRAGRFFDDSKLADFMAFKSYLGNKTAGVDKFGALGFSFGSSLYAEGAKRKGTKSSVWVAFCDLFAFGCAIGCWL